MTDIRESHHRLDDEARCVTALRAFGSGRLSEWLGLPEGCTRAHVERALGPSEPGPDGAGRLGGSPTAYRTYPPTDFAPYGVMVWFVEDQVVLLQINSPAATIPLEASLGAPDGHANSLLDYGHSQWIYAERGLTAHVSIITQDILRIYGYRPTSLEEFLESWLSKVAIRRIRRRIS